MYVYVYMYTHHTHTHTHTHTYKEGEDWEIYGIYFKELADKLQG